MDEDEKRIMKLVYKGYSYNILILYLRLNQAASNPELVLKSVDQRDVSSYFSYKNDDEDEDDEDEGDSFKLDLSFAPAQFTPEEEEFIKKHSKTRKIDRAVELAAERVKNDEPVVIWGIFVANLELISKKLNAKGVSNVVINGYTPQEEREKIIRDFCDRKVDVLITNPHTLAESISLHTVCHYAIYVEYDFNLTHMIQSRDRIHRLGLREDQKTEYTYMILDSKGYEYNSIDLRTYLRLKEKEKVMIDAVEGSDITVVDDNYIEDVKFILNR